MSIILLCAGAIEDKIEMHLMFGVEGPEKKWWSFCF